MKKTHPARLTSDRRPIQTVVRILLNWALIFGTLVVASRFPSPLVYLLTFLVVSVEQHALGLWMHESAHWLLTSRKRVNDLLANILLAGPLFIPLRAYRGQHFRHHGYLGTAQDSKRVIFTDVSGWGLVWFFIRTCFGVQVFSIARRYLTRTGSAARAGERDVPSVADILVVILMQIILFFIIVSFAPWHYYLWFWILPWITLNRFIAGLRSVAEHQPLPGEHHPFIRTLTPNMVERFLFCRAGFDYHWTHHQYPNIPYFNLACVEIPMDQPAQPPGYFSTLRKLIRAPRVTSREDTPMATRPVA